MLRLRGPAEPNVDLNVMRGTAVPPVNPASAKNNDNGAKGNGREARRFVRKPT
jgi:hypothetical protein